MSLLSLLDDHRFRLSEAPMFAGKSAGLAMGSPLFPSTNPKSEKGKNHRDTKEFPASIPSWNQQEKQFISAANNSYYTSDVFF